MPYTYRGPYQSGLARGDTPPKDIPTIGASPKRTYPESAGHLMSKISLTMPVSEFDPFAGRKDTMSLDVVQPKDTLRLPVGGGPMNYKDMDPHEGGVPTLTTSDIYRGQPAIAHPCKTGTSKEFKHIEKPDLPEIDCNRAVTNYPPIRQRPRDLSLTTSDIDGAKPGIKGLKIQNGDLSRRMVDPGNPQYVFSASEAQPSAPPRHSGRDLSLTTNDVHKACPQKLIPIRNQYRDTMVVEDEFRIQKKKAHELTMSLKANDIMGHVPNRDTGPQKSFRCSDPLNPEYDVPLTHNPPGTSLHATWTEEVLQYKGAPPTMTGTIGDIEGSKPKTLIKDNGEPTLSLLREDLPAATPMRRIGSLPYSMYGPPGNRRFSASLDTQDICGAQADTLPRGPRMPQHLKR